MKFFSNKTTSFLEQSRADNSGSPLGNLPNPVQGFQQLFNSNSLNGNGGNNPMAILGTFQTLLMPMPSMIEGIQQGQNVLNGLNMFSSLVKPLTNNSQQ